MYNNRIATSQISRQSINTIAQNRSNIQKLQEQATTEKRVNRPSDDAVATQDILYSNQKLNKMETYASNIDALNSEASVTDNVFSQFTTLLQRAKELTQVAANGTTSDVNSEAIQTEMQQIKENMVTLANTEYNGKYIFGGAKTSTEPYTLNDNGEIVYSGTPSTDDYKHEVEISDNIKLSANFTGDDVFGYSLMTDPGPPPVYEGKGIFNEMNNLNQDLLAEPLDHTKISSYLDKLDTCMDKILTSRTLVGSIQMRLEMATDQMETDEITYKQLKSNAEDADMVKVLSDLSLQNYALQTSLAVNAKTMNVSLLDYM